MKNHLLTISVIALLAACGGGGGSGTSNAIEDQEGFNTATDDEREDAQVSQDEQETTNTDLSSDTGNTGGGDESSYEPSIPVGTAVTLPSANMISIQRRNATAELLGADALQPAQGALTLTVTANADGTITLSDGSLSVDLTPDGNGNFAASAGEGNAATEIAGFLRPRSTAAGDVDTVFVTFTDFNTRREGNIVIGEVTGAAAANALTGTATYRGLMNARITSPVDAGATELDRFDALGGGRLELDFDAGTVSGRFNLNDPSAPLFLAADPDEFPRVLVELNETTITNGAFNGTVDVTFKDGGGFGNPDLAFSNGSYDGNLYGDAGTSAGGTFIGDVNNNGETLIMQGAFSVD